MGVDSVTLKKAQVTVNNNREPVLIDLTAHRYLTLLQQERLYFSFSHPQLVII